MQQQTKLTLHTHPFKAAFESPFWTLIVSAMTAIQKSDSPLDHHRDIPLILVPSASLKESILTHFATQHPHWTWMPDIMTFDDSVLGQEKRPAYKTELQWLIASEFKKNKLPHSFSSIAETPGFLEETASFILNKHKFSLSQDDFFNATSFPEKDKALFWTLLHSIEKKAEEYRFLSSPQRYASQQQKQYPILTKNVQNRWLFITGFWEFPAYQREALDALIHHAHHTNIAVAYQEGAPAYLAAHPLVSQFKNQAQHSPYHPHTEFTPPDTEVWQPASVQDEIAVIASTIQEVLRTPSWTPSHITVLYPNQAWKKQFETHCNALDLPLPAVSRPLLHTKLGNWLAATLNLCKNTASLSHWTNWTHHSFSRFLLASYNTSASAWLQELTKLPQLNAESFATLSTENKAAITALTTTFASLAATKTIAQLTIELLAWLDPLLDAYLPTQTESPLHILECEKVRDAFTPLTGTQRTLYTQPSSSSIEFLLQWLDHNDIQHATTPDDDTTPGQHIHLLSRHQHIGRQTDLLFIPSITLANWPSKPAESLWLPTTAAATLGWPTDRDYIEWDHYIFFFAAYTTQTKLILSIPDYTESKKAHPSPFIQHLEDQWNQHFPRHKKALALELNAAPPSRPNPDQITDPHHLAHLKTWHTKEYSASFLETYQKCPAYFFNQALLNEKGDEELTEEVKPDVWGSFLHHVFYRFYKEVTTQKLDLTQPDDRTQAQALLHRIAEQEWTRESDGSYYWQLKKDALFHPESGLIPLYCQSVLNSSPAFMPLELEKRVSGITITHENETMHLKGVIDVLLQNHAHQLLIMDYKTGKTLPTGSDITNHRSLQLLMYHLMIENLYPTHTILGGMYFQLKNIYYFGPQFGYVTPAGKDELELNRKRPPLIETPVLTSFKAHLFNLKKLIESGTFSPNSKTSLPHMEATRKNVCANCPYKRSCTYEYRFQS